VSVLTLCVSVNIVIVNIVCQCEHTVNIVCQCERCVSV